MIGRTRANRTVREMTAQELLETQAWLSVAMLAKIWTVNRPAAWKRLTNPALPWFAKAFEIGGQWYIETTDFKTIVRRLKSKRGANSVTNERGASPLQTQAKQNAESVTSKTGPELQ